LLCSKETILDILYFSFVDLILKGWCKIFYVVSIF